MNLGFEVKIGFGLTFNPENKIGSGAFGEIYTGSSTKGEEIAIKIESAHSKYPQLEHEAKVLQILKGGLGIPIVKTFFSTGEYNGLIMNLLGPNIETIYNHFNKKMPMKTLFQIGLQMFERIQFIHSRHFIHRDIKPENFLVGLDDQINRIYLIDFGLSKRFRNPKTGMHIPEKDGKSLIGTPKYASIYTHLGIEQSRRDDLESLGYVLIYLLKGKLPWEFAKAKTKLERFNKIMNRKINTSVEDLCQDLPNEIALYLTTVRGLHFEEKPDYERLKGLFEDVINRQNGVDGNYQSQLNLDELLKQQRKLTK